MNLGVELFSCNGCTTVGIRTPCRLLNFMTYGTILSMSIGILLAGYVFGLERIAQPEGKYDLL